MKYRRYTEAEVLAQTRETIRHFTNKELEPFLAVLDKNFAWVGDYSALFTRGVDAFLESVREESQEPPVLISEEEYALAAHENRLWAAYGRFAASYRGEDGSLLVSRVHFSFVWKQVGNDLRLAQATATHLRDGGEGAPVQTQSRIFDTLPLRRAASGGPGKKLELRGTDRRIRYLAEDEILYIRSHVNVCEVFTASDSFTVRATLRSLERPSFYLIHQSYLVNTAYIDRVYRYRAVLADGRELPIGKQRYLDLRRHLKEKTAGFFDSLPLRGY